MKSNWEPLLKLVVKMLADEVIAQHFDAARILALEAKKALDEIDRQDASDENPSVKVGDVWLVIIPPDRTDRRILKRQVIRKYKKSVTLSQLGLYASSSTYLWADVAFVELIDGAANEGST